MCVGCGGMWWDVVGALGQDSICGQPIFFFPPNPHLSVLCHATPAVCSAQSAQSVVDANRCLQPDGGVPDPPSVTVL